MNKAMIMCVYVCVCHVCITIALSAPHHSVWHHPAGIFASYKLSAQDDAGCMCMCVCMCVLGVEACSGRTKYN